MHYRVLPPPSEKSGLVPKYNIAGRDDLPIISPVWLYSQIITERREKAMRRASSRVAAFLAFVVPLLAGNAAWTLAHADATRSLNADKARVVRYWRRGLPGETRTSCPSPRRAGTMHRQMQVPRQPRAMCQREARRLHSTDRRQKTFDLTGPCCMRRGIEVWAAMGANRARRHSGYNQCCSIPVITTSWASSASWRTRVITDSNCRLSL
jgi:hypothetical protein